MWDGETMDDPNQTVKLWESGPLKDSKILETGRYLPKFPEFILHEWLNLKIPSACTKTWDKTTIWYARKFQLHWPNIWGLWKKTCDIDFLNSGVQRKKQHQTSQTSGTRIFSLGLTIKVDVIRHLKDWAKLRSQKSKGWALLVSYMGEPHQDLKGLRVQGTTEDLPSDDLWVVLPTQPFTGPSLRSTW